MKELDKLRNIAFEIEVLKDIIYRFDSLKYIDPIVSASVSGDLEKIKYSLMCIEDTFLIDRERVT